MGTSPKNKKLLLDFAEDSLFGLNGDKIEKVTVNKHLSRLVVLLKRGGFAGELEYFGVGDTKAYLLWLEKEYGGVEKAWSKNAYQITLRKFIKWVRGKYGYPLDYPEREKAEQMLVFGKNPVEVNYGLSERVIGEDKKTMVECPRCKELNP